MIGHGVWVLAFARTTIGAGAAAAVNGES